MLGCHDALVPLNVLIVDDHASFRREATGMLRAAGFAVVGEAIDGASAVAQASRRCPDVRADQPLCHRGSRRGRGRTRRAGFRADRGPGEVPGAANLVCGHKAGERRRDERRGDYSVASDHAGAVREALRICSGQLAFRRPSAGHRRGFSAWLLEWVGLSRR
jgi:hypothetical protein